MKTERGKKGSPKDLVCCYCGKGNWKSTYTYNLHLYGHGAVAPKYQCEICSKSYFRNDQYKIHLDRHLQQQKRHYCDYCGRGFIDKRTLIRHLRIHDDNPTFPDRKNHECVYCKVGYAEARQLFYHIQKNHLAKPNHLKKDVNDTWVEAVQNTPNCVEITKIKNNVLSIKKIDIKHSKDDMYQEIQARLFAQKETQFRKVKCDYCNKEMLKKSILNHIRERHLKLKKFVCKTCKIAFSRHYMLMNHICGVTGCGKRGKKGKTQTDRQTKADKSVKTHF